MDLTDDGIRALICGVFGVLCFVLCIIVSITGTG